ncbi:retrovirus-related pol polyprotein from transposon TNT 1-94, partial [Tanacetum coccineum]
YLMVYKSDDLEVIKDFLEFVELQFETKVKRIRSDNTLEFVKGPCALFLASHGIYSRVLQEETVVPNTPNVPSLSHPTSATTTSIENQVGKSTSTLMTHQDPKGFIEAIKELGWCDAVNVELGALVENGTWELADLPPNKKVIGSHWIFKTKSKVDGSVGRKKARLVIQGSSLIKGIDYEDPFAPVA